MGLAFRTASWWLVLAVIVAPLGAQDRVTDALAMPDSVLRPSERDAEFASWLQAQVEAGRRESPEIIQAGRFEVLVLSPLTRASLEPDSVFSPMVMSCAETMDLHESQVIELIGSDPWKAFEDAAAGVSVIAFSIVPSHAATVNCGASNAARHAALARGVRFVRTSMYNQFNDASRAELWANGVRVAPVLSGSRPVTQVARATLRHDGTTQLRIYVLPDQLAPDDSGRLPQVELHVWNAAEADPQRIAVSEEALHRLWDSELRWRAARIATANTPASARPILPTPGDTALRSALSQLSSGDIRGAAVRTVDRLQAGGLGKMDRLTAQLMLGLAFEAEGDVAAAQLVFADAVTDEPCLTFDTATNPRFSRMLDAARPEARCTTRSLPLVAASSFLPGFGQFTSGRRLGMGIAAVGTVAVAFAAAYAKHAEARKTFADYEAITGFDPGGPAPKVTFQRAESARMAGNTLVHIGVSIWVLAGVEAVLHEYRHRRALRTVQGFGGSSSRVGLSALPGGISVSVELFR